jgi:hypothetical protein
VSICFTDKSVSLTHILRNFCYKTIG